MYITIIEIKLIQRKLETKDPEENEEYFFDILDYADGSQETVCPKPCLETRVE